MAPVVNTFAGMQMSFPNGGIHSVIATAFTFRKQLTTRTELLQASGWNDQLNEFMKRGLLQLTKHVKRITYNPVTVQTKTGPASTQGTGSAANTATGPSNTNPASGPVNGAGKTLEQLQREAADTTKSLKDQFDANSPNTDGMLMPSLTSKPVVHVVDGSDDNIPLLDPSKYQNDHLRLFVSGLDNFIVQMTRLDSRNDPQYISKDESAMVQGYLADLWTICEVFGGEANRTSTPTGTLPSQEPGKAAT